MWTAVSSPASDALQCLCMCMEKEHLLTAILESGRCYCAPGASQLGNVTAQTTWPAACPMGTDRVSFSVSQHVEALMQYCRYSPLTGRKSLRIGDTGKYTQVTFSVFDNIAMTRLTSSESNVAALHTGRNVLGRTSTVQTIHQKKGTLATTRECNLRKGPTGWDFHLEVLETSTVDYIERFELSKKDAMKKRTYERISIFL
ncbi:uncharacterized protein LOC122374919 [Amphibalanus amphitrite]|uniref:uncharacterized protein LOC122374919 n=1 Tax=Amphibalanus amphitrite TaxID=1232801 RepID=UPI001C90471F|nr:uncharacterized protein LOC122374919 [Amphibalanus amphitrite]